MKRKIMTIITATMAAGSTAMIFAVNAFAEDEAAAADSAQQTAQSGGSILTFILPLVLMFVLLYFMAIRPQKKRDAEAKQMQDSLQVGDEVITSGGIVGMIFRIADDTVVIETGGERHKLRIKKWAIAENITERMRAAQAKTKLKGVESAGVEAVEETPKSKKKKKSEESDEQ